MLTCEAAISRMTFIKSRLHKQVSEYTNSGQPSVKLSLSLFLSRMEYAEDNSKIDSFRYCFITARETSVLFIGMFVEAFYNSSAYFFFLFCIIIL